MKWNVIWQVNPDDLLSCIERDWFYEIMSLVPIESVSVDYQARPMRDRVLPHSIVCASCPNQTSQSDLVDYLQRLPRPRVLYHMSDEYVEVGHDLYRHCELAIRNGSANFECVSDANFIQLPLGYVSGLRNATRGFSSAGSRKCSFAFLGTMKNERKSEMLPALRAIAGPHHLRKSGSFITSTTRFDAATITIYKNTVFVPNPKGNWNPECNRLYDVLEWGCIPLIKRYTSSPYHENYHDRLLGQHPIPTFDEWTHASEFANRLLSDETALDALQHEISAWWNDYKSALQVKIANALAKLA